MVGQINIGSQLGEIIYQIARDENNKVFMEVGTWNGLGSTKCFIDGLIERSKNNWVFLSLEANSKYHQLALSFHVDILKKYSNIYLIHGRIVGEKDIIETGFGLNALKQRDEYNPMHEKFLDEDITNYTSCPDINDLLNKYNILDVVLLDGGEFSTYAEFNLLKKKTKIFILDDTLKLKNKRVIQELNDDHNWSLIKQSHDRNGFAIYKCCLNG